MMKIVFISPPWRSIRSRSTSEKSALVFMAVTFVFFLKYLASGRSKYILDYTGTKQDDTNLISYVRKELFRPPGEGDLHLNEPSKNDFSVDGQSKILADIFKNKAGGSFLEVLTGDGENGSISLYLERELRWSGLLVEDDLEEFKLLVPKNRRAFSICSGISITDIAILYYNRQRDLRDLYMDEVAWDIPLYSLYQAMGGQVLDVLILNAYGNEFEVLETIPWNLTTIRVICVDHTEKETKITQLLGSHGYSLIQRHTTKIYYGNSEFANKKG